MFAISPQNMTKKCINRNIFEEQKQNENEIAKLNGKYLPLLIISSRIFFSFHRDLNI